MAGYDKVDKSTVSEMLEARERGMNNHQISEHFGLCYKTVLNHIGRQPIGVRAEYGQRKQPKDAVTQKTLKKTIDTFRMQPLTETFMSSHYSWILDHVHGCVQFGDRPDQITKSQAVDIMAALNAVMPYLRDAENCVGGAK